ncbi:4-hydroxy-tetrahydrodipicolinate synthase [Methanopyrus kandleri]|uniref:4-hydroxy-tetrahydrodipicolinate synthase n=1 Tax=Methanopyrus kandleri (strain AV19 / DSM 6324 / JCM 9639 / NBRC 100938) TaxID=190192 RepID=DAPA_METKA|nr:4-hydroxy-tetrahydrodipicolinate synthase [Methanopyrus kandleri]Q8TUZ4.1 RecName: Full=4-hydroxy-tetrahydrodipicolinate synthase; Short=HTPA synthase [Methanopyrus kandleri AV19]AAM02820.1 Dihydrodipicolinate synthase/N-acetylneuraminate lyase [Methanopyrus kandleri AV19]
MGFQIEGVIPALITPFTDDLKGINEEGLRENVSRLLEAGVHGVVPAGTTGESSTLSHAEHRRVIEIVVDEVNGKVPVIAGAGSNSTREALELSTYAEDVGADAILSVVPYYNKPPQEGLFIHFSKIAEAVECPIILYNVPSRTGCALEPETAAKLAEEYSHIVGVKEASGDLDVVQRFIEETPDDFILLSGVDELTLPILAVGGVGVISVTANVAPELMVEMYEAWKSGDVERARELHYELLPLHRALFTETNPIPVKAAVELVGMASSPPRPPLKEAREDTKELLRRELKKLGLLPEGG